MGVVITDNSDAFLKRLEAAVDGPGGGLDTATQFLAAKMRESMPGAGAAVIQGTGGDTGVRARYVASTPGSPPGVRTGQLRNSITNAKVDRLRWASGTNVAYAKHLEFGTADMPARPFMRPALRNNEAAIGRVFNARVRRKMGGGA
jgi:HK97 gp10 family phage protein